MLVSFLPAFDAFRFLAKGRSEAYGSREVPEGTRTIGPRLANKGRKVAMEAAMIPRFISSLVLLQPHVVAHKCSLASTHMANTALITSSSRMTIRASFGR